MAVSTWRCHCVMVAVLMVSVWVMSASAEKHKFAQGESVTVWANKVGPFNNPQEYYMFFSLPYCRPDKAVGTMESLGESISGYELRQTKTDLRFGVDNNNGFLCEKVLTFEEASLFAFAVQHQYWYQFFIDNLPVWGMVGEVVEVGDARQLYLYTHVHFDISKNNDRVVGVDLISENAVPVQEGQSVSFTFSATWHDSTVPYSQRFNKYLDTAFYEHQIHWFSVFNAVMLLVFLLGLVAIVLLRTLHKEYTLLDEGPDDDDMMDESGWKLLHRDVFRPPSRLVAFSALYGTGLHLAVVTLVTLLLAMGTRSYRGRGTTLNFFILAYAFTSFVAGFFSGRYYADNKGQNWIKASLMTAGLFPSFWFAVTLLCNFMAKSYGALSHVPVFTLLLLLGLWAIVCLPLTFIGTFIGRHLRATKDGVQKHRVNQMPRLIPTRPWYLQPWVNIALGGILPFAAIFIELYFLYTSLWHYKYYYVFGFASVIFSILMVVTFSVSVVSTYFLLNNENHKWHWKSFLTGASTGVYVFIYSLFYYSNRTHMSGMLQLSLYLGQTALISTVISLFCGAVAFMGSSWFVSKIYAGLKVE